MATSTAPCWPSKKPGSLEHGGPRKGSCIEIIIEQLELKEAQPKILVKMILTNNTKCLQSSKSSLEYRNYLEFFNLDVNKIVTTKNI